MTPEERVQRAQAELAEALAQLARSATPPAEDPRIADLRWQFHNTLCAYLDGEIDKEAMVARCDELEAAAGVTLRPDAIKHETCPRWNARECGDGKLGHPWEEALDWVRQQKFMGVRATTAQDIDHYLHIAQSARISPEQWPPAGVSPETLGFHAGHDGDPKRCARCLRLGKMLEWDWLIAGLGSPPARRRTGRGPDGGQEVAR